MAALRITKVFVASPDDLAVERRPFEETKPLRALPMSRTAETTFAFACYRVFKVTATLIFVAGVSVQWSAAAWGADNEAPAAAQKPWSVFGRVTDADGNPSASVAITAHTGAGTLFLTGKAETDSNGKYEFDFGPGIRFSEKGTQLQAATIVARKSGLFEKNLSRQGDLLCAYKLPKGNVEWGKKIPDDVILPGRPRRIDFVMVPAARVSGTLIDEDEKPLASYSVSFIGEQLPPSSSVVVSSKTDEKGRFVLEDVPVGFAWQFLIEPRERRSPWNAWASGNFQFVTHSDEHGLSIQESGKVMIGKRFEVQIVGEGVSWREALKLGGRQQKLDIKVDSSDKKTPVPATRIRLVLDP